MIVDILKSVAVFLLSDVTTTLAFLVVTLIAWTFIKNRGLPPGPTGIPFLGYLPFLGMGAPEETFHKLSQRYGQVMSLQLGPCLFVVLGNYETLKEAYVKQGDLFSGRPHETLLLKLDEAQTGVFITEGENWREHRRFILSTLRDSGMGKSSLEPKILEEIRFFLDVIAEQKGQPYDFSASLGMSTLNQISSLEFGKRFDYEDKTFFRLRRLMEETSKLFGLVSIRAFFPFLSKIPLLDKWTHRVEFQKLHETTIAFYRDRIREHAENYVEGSKDDLVDAYLSERKSVISKTGSEGHFSIRELEGDLDALFEAGSDTVTSTMKWAIMLTLCYPAMQDKLHKEIDNIIGMERTPTMSDKARMIYTDAFLLEVQRYASVVSLNLFHVNLEEAELYGYRIPKRSVIVTNLWAVHYDPSLWEEPTKFMPERFINDKGQIQKPEYFIPFGIGKRACLGESLARMEIFLYFTSMLQRFTFLPPKNVTPTIQYESGLSRKPKPFKFRAIEREGYQVRL